MIKAYQQFELLGKKTFEKAVVKPPFRLIAEMPNEACFYYVVSGEAGVLLPTERVDLAAAEGLVLRCGNYLNDYLQSSQYEECEAIAIHLYPEVLKALYDQDFPDFLLDANEIQPLQYDRVRGSALLTNYIESLQFYFANPEMVSDELLKLKLKELILLLARTDNAATIRQLVAGLFSTTSYDFRAVIEANIYKNLSLEELATLTSLSLSSFKREFKRHYDEAPARYLRRQRLEKASKLLRGTDMRISDIAFECGFSDLAHFSRTFQKMYQQSPTEYRLNQIDKSLD